MPNGPVVDGLESMTDLSFAVASRLRADSIVKPKTSGTVGNALEITTLTVSPGFAVLPGFLSWDNTIPGVDEVSRESATKIRSLLRSSMRRAESSGWSTTFGTDTVVIGRVTIPGGKRLTTRRAARVKRTILSLGMRA